MYVDIEIYKSDDGVCIVCCQELNLYANARTEKLAVTKLRKIIDEFINKHDPSFEANKDIDYTSKYYSEHSPQTH